jgi:hypothetical protein
LQTWYIGWQTDVGSVAISIITFREISNQALETYASPSAGPASNAGTRRRSGARRFSQIFFPCRFYDHITDAELAISSNRGAEFSLFALFTPVASFLVLLKRRVLGAENERKFSAYAAGGKEQPGVQSKTKESYDDTDWVIVWPKGSRVHISNVNDLQKQ